MRYTKKDVMAQYKRLMRALKVEPCIGHVGYSIDYNAIYGGYVIVFNHEDTSESHPFGMKRRNAKEMVLSLEMACEVLEYVNRGGE